MWEIVTKLPGVFALCVAGLTLIGGAVGAVIGYFITRKTDGITDKAHDRLIEAKDDTIKTKDETIKSLESTTERLRTEKEEYKQSSHVMRNNAQAAELKIKDLEMRPDVTVLLTHAQESAKALGDIAKLIASHDEKLDQRMKQHMEPIQVAQKEISANLKLVSDGMNQFRNWFEAAAPSRRSEIRGQRSAKRRG